MELLYRGFDGLDVSFKGHIDTDFCRALEIAKIQAQKFRSDAYLDWRGIQMMVKESGARGGYAYIASTGMFGATWFFKRPNSYDPWGVRVSCSSFQLALNGIAETRSQLAQVLMQMGILVESGGESISRVDYAFDFRAPDFELVPDHFVMHSNTRRADHIENGVLKVNGKSGRTTSVTVGMMPGRQVILYDKRAEVIAKQKIGWWEIWNSELAKRGECLLEPTDPSQSRVWRVELRAGKHQLKQVWNIKSWADLESRIGPLFISTLKAVRYTRPNSDSNRSRWPNHKIWDALSAKVLDDFSQYPTNLSPDTVKQVQFETHDSLLLRQILGLVISRAGLRQLRADDLPTFIRQIGDELGTEIDKKRNSIERKLKRSTERHRVVFQI